VTSSTSTFNAKVVVGTHFECAWQAFMNQTAHTSGFPAGSTAAVTPHSCVPSQQVAQDVTLSLTGLSSFQLLVSSFQMVIGVGVE
jgi:hypothetical protein